MKFMKRPLFTLNEHLKSKQTKWNGSWWWDPRITLVHNANFFATILISKFTYICFHNAIIIIISSSHCLDCQLSSAHWSLPTSIRNLQTNTYTISGKYWMFVSFHLKIRLIEHVSCILRRMSDSDVYIYMIAW